MNTYRISVCPKCADGPLVFDPNGLDLAEGMAARAECRNGHVTICGKDRRIEVVPRLAVCLCGTSQAWCCPLHVNSVLR